MAGCDREREDVGKGYKLDETKLCEMTLSDLIMTSREVHTGSGEAVSLPTRSLVERVDGIAGRHFEVHAHKFHEDVHEDLGMKSSACTTEGPHARPSPHVLVFQDETRSTGRVLLITVPYEC